MTRYLIVDDSPTARLALSCAVRNADPGRGDISEAADPERGLASFRDAPPDVVFLDMVMDDRGGLAGLDTLRAMLRARPQTRIVLVTSLPPEHPDLISAIGEGAFGHIRKPVRTEAIRVLLHEVEAESGRLGRIR